MEKELEKLLKEAGLQELNLRDAKPTRLNHALCTFSENCQEQNCSSKHCLLTSRYLCNFIKK